MIEREKISSINEFKDFLKTNIWHDIQNELLDWLDIIHCQLEDPSVGSTELPGGITDKELHRLGGNAETIRKVMSIVDIIIEQLNQDNEKEEIENGV